MAYCYVGCPCREPVRLSVILSDRACTAFIIWAGRKQTKLGIFNTQKPQNGTDDWVTRSKVLHVLSDSVAIILVCIGLKIV